MMTAYLSFDASGLAMIRKVTPTHDSPSDAVVNGVSSMVQPLSTSFER